RHRTPWPRCRRSCSPSGWWRSGGSGCCGCRPCRALPDRLQRAGIELRRHLGDRPLVVMASGGLASMAAAALVARSVPAEQVTAVHVDTGLLRHGETDQTIAALQALGLHRVEVVDARADVGIALAGAADGAAKDRA